MPYVENENLRVMLKPATVASNKGELNLQICMVMEAYLERKLFEGGVVGYHEIADALSSCHEAEQEFRRRILVPYELKKMSENGDVFSDKILSLAEGEPGTS